MKIKVFTLNSFAKTNTGGNPAGVVLGAENLSENDMLTIANIVGFSETAFIQKSDKANFKVRFFTPTNEVDICGHATIATFFLLFKKGLIKQGNYSQETKAGVLNIEISEKEVVFMDQPLPEFFQTIDKKEIADSLCVSEKQFLNDLPVQIVSTGLKDMVIPIKSLTDLFSIRPRFDGISAICKKYDAIGFHAFTLETKYGSTAHCRNFAPLYGIPEESATGTANGALSCYLFHYGRVLKEQSNNLVFEQGYSLNKPSEIFARLKIEDSTIKQVQVGGTAIIAKEIEIRLNTEGVKTKGGVNLTSICLNV